MDWAWIAEHWLLHKHQILTPQRALKKQQARGSQAKFSRQKPGGGGGSQVGQGAGERQPWDLAPRTVPGGHLPTYPLIIFYPLSNQICVCLESSFCCQT